MNYEGLQTQFVEMACALFAEYYQENVHQLHEETFEDRMLDDTAELLAAQLDEAPDTEALAAALGVFRCMYPCRTAFSALCPPVAALPVYSPPPYAQRSPEWYAYRHNLITASAVYKTLGSPSELNSLVVEKCSPPATQASLGTSGARHWGVRYEPVSALYYESTYATKLQEYACIVHPHYPFLGASPDGVNALPGTPVYGRMLEIKNPVSREITGVPKREYWIQIQAQLEVLDLESCDLLETRFTEYGSREDFYADGTFSASADGKPKGVIIYFQNEGAYDYAYAPYGCDEATFDAWEKGELEKPNRTWVVNLYWKLETALCTTVPRNRAWFAANLPRFEEVWRLIERERVSGEWTRRLPKKRSTPQEPTWCQQPA
jgi:putative phage-type endonuclease